MSSTATPIPLLSFRISELSTFDYCPKRCKIQCFKQYEVLPEKTGNCMVTGSQMHRQYTAWMNQTQLTFDREFIIKQLLKILIDGAFQRQLDNILIRGVPDEFRVLTSLLNGQKYISLLEIKTTSRKFMWNCEMRSAALQLQLYIWLLKDAFEALGYKMWKHHFVEVYSQKSKILMSRIMVEEDPNIEAKIRYIIRAFQGLAPMTMPNKSACRLCPKIVKINCPWRQEIEHGHS